MQLKLVILDNIQAQMGSENPDYCRAKQIFSDLICLRQHCYSGVRNEFLNLDANDLCATHIALYDISKVYAPKLVAGIRICYEERAKSHLIQVPFYDRMKEIHPLFDSEWRAFRAQNKLLVNPNMLYVAPNTGFNKTGLPLSEIILWSMAMKIREAGYNSYCATINDDFKISRWFKNFGDWDPNLNYLHPGLLKNHKVMFMNSIFDSYLEDGMKKYKDLYELKDEMAPKKSSIDRNEEQQAAA